MNIDLQYITDENTIFQLCDLTRATYSALFKFDKNNGTENFLENILNSENRQFCLDQLTSFYKSKISRVTLIDHENILSICQVVDDIDEKINRLNLTSEEAGIFWYDIYNLILTNNEQTQINNSFDELLEMYFIANKVETELLGKIVDPSIRLLVSGNFTRPYIIKIMSNVTNKVEKIKNNLIPMYTNYKYDSTNGILDNYFVLFEQVNLINELIKSTNIPNVTLYCKDQIYEIYVEYTKILKCDQAFVIGNIETLKNINTTILKVNNDINKIKSKDVDFVDINILYNDLESSIHEKIFMYYKLALGDIIVKQDIFSQSIHNDSTLQILKLFKNAHNSYLIEYETDDDTNNIVVKKMLKTLVSNIYSKIIKTGQTIFKPETNLHIVKTMEYLKGNLVIIIGDTYKTLDSVKLVSDSFNFVNIVTSYIMDNNMSERSESSYKNKFIEQFGKADIYNQLHNLKMQSRAIKTQIIESGHAVIKSGTQVAEQQGTKLFNRVSNVVSTMVTKVGDDISKVDIFDQNYAKYKNVNDHQKY